MSRLRTPHKIAAGLGSAKAGTGHFIAQRVTAIALVPLVLWLMYALVVAFDGGYAGARAFLGDPVTAVLLLLLVTAALYHLQLGLRVVIEDYLAGAGRTALLLLNLFACATLWVATAVSILMVVLRGA